MFVYNGEREQRAQGMMARAEQIPEGASQLWNMLSRAYGAAATLTVGNECYNFFYSQQAATKFIEMIRRKMTIPVLDDGEPITRKEYDDRVGKIENKCKYVTIEN